ncbi:hypothetical protein VTJ04DRAFT_2782 [Mycothermus thermophilus]|uniref:uncharacterized protein n=1 Tax=Humicola insolens TaxID=85995 RepID=UPI00374281B4
MSWTQVPEPYFKFQEVSKSLHPQRHSFPVTIWEMTDENPKGHIAVDNQDFAPGHLEHSAALRIITAPLDELRPESGPGLVKLCQTLKIPHEFLNERLRAVCHSYGTRTELEDAGNDSGSGGFCAWFHYLCKAVEPDETRQRREWDRSAFFLRKHSAREGGGVTLVMFGPLPEVKRRIQQFIDMKCFRDAIAEPFALFDLVLDGLFHEVDSTMWQLLEVIYELENVSSHLIDGIGE